MKKIAFLFFGIVMFSCEEMPAKEITIDESRTQIAVTEKEDSEPEIIIQKRIPDSKKIQCNFGDILIDIEEKENELYISSNCKVVNDFSIAINGSIIKFIETDVNADGFNEFYCITNKGDLIAYASYKNKSFGEIYVRQMPKVFYDNLKDVESWEVKNNKLHITLSNTKDEVLKTVRYKLIKGETGYKLEAN